MYLHDAPDGVLVPHARYPDGTEKIYTDAEHADSLFDRRRIDWKSLGETTVRPSGADLFRVPDDLAPADAAGVSIDPREPSFAGC